MYIEGMNEEFAPSDEGASEYAEPRSYRDTTPEPTFEAEPGPLDPETEERVRRQSERFRRAAPAPGSAETLAEQGYAVRTVD